MIERTIAILGIMAMTGILTGATIQALFMGNVAITSVLSGASVFAFLASIWTIAEFHVERMAEEMRR